MRFTQVIGCREIPAHIKSCLEEQPARSGNYNWIFAHKGEINTYEAVKDRLHEYDVIQVNMSPADMHIIPLIRERLGDESDTKLVLNNDYVCECWGKWDVGPHYYDHIQKMGDMVFGTEAHQVSNMINGSFVLPHPTNTGMLKKVGTDIDRSSVGYIFHWWAGQSHLGHRTLEKVKEKYKIQSAVVYGYNPEDDEMRRYSKIMWDRKIPLMPFPDFAELVQSEKCIYDPNPNHTYGRNGVELACWGVPVVGSDRVFSYNFLFPDLVCDPFDFKATMEKFDIVFNQPEKLKIILDNAYKKVEYFNYENSLKRYMDAFNTAIKRGGHKWYKING